MRHTRSVVKCEDLDGCVHLCDTVVCYFCFTVDRLHFLSLKWSQTLYILSFTRTFFPAHLFLHGYFMSPQEYIVMFWSYWLSLCTNKGCFCCCCCCNIRAAETTRDKFLICFITYLAKKDHILILMNNIEETSTSITVTKSYQANVI